MKKYFSFFAALILLFGPVVTTAQAVTPIPASASVSLSMTVQAAASMVCTPASISFTYTGGTGTASAPISCTFSWNVGPGYTFIDFVAYLNGGATAGLSGPTSIPASNIFSSNDNGAPVPCTQTTPGILGGSNAGCYVLLPSSPNLTGNNGTMTHTFLLSVSQGGLTAGTYTGSLTVVADVQ